ncbi:MAG: MaoC family dehydratase [Burkholderiaceae bacterium]
MGLSVDDPGHAVSDPKTVELSRLREHVGRELVVSDWLEVTQAHIDEFADATGDRQWIHVDPERAARESPYGGTIAHGFMTLSLLTRLLESALVVVGARAGINVGFNRVRFTAPVRVASRIRGRFVLAALDEVDGGVQLTWNVTVEREGETKPALVAEWIGRLLR